MHFKKIFEENDIICLTETWRDKFDWDVLSWDDNFSEHPKNANRQSKRGRSSGGTTLFVKNKFQSYGNIEKQNTYHVIYKLDKNLFPALDKHYISVFCTYHQMILDGFNLEFPTISKNLCQT